MRSGACVSGRTILPFVFTVALLATSLLPATPAGGTPGPGRILDGGFVQEAGSRAQHPSAEDRTVRSARVLPAGAAPHSSMEVAAAIQPRRADGQRWSVAVQVSLETRSLEPFDGDGREEAHLDVGALLEDVERRWSREFLGGGEVRRSVEMTAGGVLLFEHVIEGLRPGRYRLRAFVHDRVLDQSGRAEATMVLPHPRRGGVTGPLASIAGKKVYRFPLPLMRKESGAGGGVVLARADSPPLGAGSVRRGEPLRMTSWVCPGAGTHPGRLIRYLEHEGVPVFQARIGWAGEAGRCEQWDDLLHTVELEPGRYTYRVVRREEAEGAEPREVFPPVTFEIVEKGAGDDEVTPSSD